ncbi:hypothetical protein BKA80DRAFT_258699 [Phyllosticta citrichinensis]
MAPNSPTTTLSATTTLRGLKTRLKTTQAILGEARAKLAKMELGITQLQDLRSRRSGVVEAERERLQQQNGELKGLAHEAHEVAGDLAAKKQPELKRLPRTPPGKQPFQYVAHEAGGNVKVLPQHANVDRQPNSVSSGGTFVDAHQDRIDSPMREEKHKSRGSDDKGFVSARQSLEDPFID